MPKPLLRCALESPASHFNQTDRTCFRRWLRTLLTKTDFVSSASIATRTDSTTPDCHTWPQQKAWHLLRGGVQLVRQVVEIAASAESQSTHPQAAVHHQQSCPLTDQRKLLLCLATDRSLGLEDPARILVLILALSFFCSPSARGWGAINHVPTSSCFWIQSDNADSNETKSDLRYSHLSLVSSNNA